MQLCQMPRDHLAFLPITKAVKGVRTGTVMVYKRTPSLNASAMTSKEAVYHVVLGKDSFTKVMRDIAQFVRRQFKEAGEFCTAKVDKGLEDLAEPVAPTDADDHVELKLRKMA